MIELLSAAGVLIFGLVVSWFAGRNHETKKRAQRDAEAMRKAREIRREIESLPDDDIADEFDRLREKRRR